MPLTDKNLIAKAILEYLGAHPGAIDTVEGIAQWWFPNANGTVSTQAVLDALCRLITEGNVVARLGPDGRLLYKLKQEVRRDVN